MKRVNIPLLFVLILLVAGSLAAQQQQQQQEQQAQQAPPANLEQQQALQTIMQTPSHQERATLAEQFLAQYPGSPFAGRVCLLASDAFRQTNNFAKAIEYGEQAVALNPQDPLSRIIVADALAESSSKDELNYEEKLVRAEQHAKRALEILPQFFEALQMPPTITPEQMAQQKNLIEAQPHATLGYIYILRNEHEQAVEELKKATELGASQPNAMDFIRLGHAYMLLEKYEEAVATFRRAVALGGPLYEAAQQRLQLAEQKLAERQGAVEKPPEEKPPQPPRQP